MPLQASENINKMIGVDATSKSVRVKAAWTIRPLRRLVVDPNRSIGELSRSRPAWTRRAPSPVSTSEGVRRARRRRLRVGC
jgi:hypothetical protein